MKERSDPQIETWARRANQNHIVQARVRAQQANDFMREQKWESAVALLSIAFDHLLQALTHPAREADIEQRIRHEREIAYQRGVQDGKGVRPQ